MMFKKFRNVWQSVCQFFSDAFNPFEPNLLVQLVKRDIEQHEKCKGTKVMNDRAYYAMKWDFSGWDEGADSFRRSSDGQSFFMKYIVDDEVWWLKLDKNLPEGTEIVPTPRREKARGPI
jgi:hypothetical protein